MDDFVLKNKNYFPRNLSNIFRMPNYIDGRVGLKVFDFHPIHIFINTQSSEHYQQCKAYYQIPEELADLRFEGIGVCTLFEDILKYLSKNNIKTKTLSELEMQFRNGLK